VGVCGIGDHHGPIDGGFFPDDEIGTALPCLNQTKDKKCSEY